MVRRPASRPTRAGHDRRARRGGGGGAAEPGGGPRQAAPLGAEADGEYVLLVLFFLVLLLLLLLLLMMMVVVVVVVVGVPLVLILMTMSAPQLPPSTRVSQPQKSGASETVPAHPPGFESQNRTTKPPPCVEEDKAEGLIFYIQRTRYEQKIDRRTDTCVRLLL